MISWRQVGLAVIMLAGLVTQALAEVQSLGHVRVPVSDRDTATRNQAIEQGLEQVLIRLSGQLGPRQLPGADALFSSPSRWVQQFGYEQAVPEQVATAAEPADPAATGGVAPGLELAMQFDVSAVISAMEKAGLPVWATHRPPVLVWLVLQRPGFGEILARDASDPSRQKLAGQARVRGLPLVLPAMDERDQARISPADIRGRFDQVMNEASEPYGVRFRLAAVLYTGQTPRLRWRLLDGTAEVAEGELSGTAEQDLLADLVNVVSDYYVSRYTVRAGAGVERQLTVRGVGSLQDWRTLEGYLAGLAGMQQARMASLAGQDVTFALVFTGSDEQLLRLLEVNRHLRPCAPEAVGGQIAVSPLPAQADQPAEDQNASAGLPDLCWQS